MALVLVKFGKGEEIARTIFEISRENDDLLLIQNGVLWALDEETMKSLKDKIKQGPLKFEEALDITTQIAKGLEKAHAKKSYTGISNQPIFSLQKTVWSRL